MRNTYYQYKTWNPLLKKNIHYSVYNHLHGGKILVANIESTNKKLTKNDKKVIHVYLIEKMNALLRLFKCSMLETNFIS